MTYSKKFLAGSVFVLFVGLAIFLGGKSNGWFEAEAAEPETETAAEPEPNKKPEKETPLEVEAGLVTYGDLVERVVSQGRVHGYQKMDVLNEVSGRLMIAVPSIMRAGN